MPKRRRPKRDVNVTLNKRSKESVFDGSDIDLDEPRTESVNKSNTLTSLAPIGYRTPSPGLQPESEETKLTEISSEVALETTPKNSKRTNCDVSVITNNFKKGESNSGNSSCFQKGLFKSKSETEIPQLIGVCNVNPYFDYKIADLKSFKENTVNEQSFFTLDALRNKPASTPIDTNNSKKGRLLNDQTGSGKSRRQTSQRRRSSLITERITINKKRAQQRQLDQKVKKILSHTAPVNVLTPEVVHSYTLRNFSCFPYSALSNDSQDTPAVTKLFNNLKKFGNAIAKWAWSIVKMGISTLCVYCKKDMQAGKVCDCPKYHDEMTKLNNRVDELSTSVLDVKLQLLDKKRNDVTLEALKSHLDDITKEVETLHSLRGEMEKLQFEVRTRTTSTPPPPPPPPPPPIPITTVNSVVPTKKLSVSTNTSRNNETIRPLITLDDILKVKLKKTSERQVSKRRTTQPEVPLGMMQQVTLRTPSSRLKPSTSHAEFSSEGSTSPHSSLKKLLKDDSSFRVKRLRRKVGYSLDDTYKKITRTAREKE